MATMDSFCLDCGHVGPAKHVTPGSSRLAFLLWCALIVPGLVYSLWRRSGRTEACALCGHASLLPADSPVARGMIAAADTVPPAAVPWSRSGP
jgi:hypothetical protein